jgi:hypothetical protein
MNGGFSLRQKTVSLLAINKISQESVAIYRNKHCLQNAVLDGKVHAEDVYFYHAFELLDLNMPNNEECANFCIQNNNTYCNQPIAIHGFYHGYLSHGKLVTLFSKLETPE